jgi:hypothetical protein
MHVGRGLTGEAVYLLSDDTDNRAAGIVTDHAVEERRYIQGQECRR